MTNATAAHLEHLYHTCVADAAADGAQLMRRVLASALKTLQLRVSAASGSMERQTMVEAMVLLEQQGEKLCEDFPQALLSAFASAAASDQVKTSAPLLPRFDELELMDESQVQESVEIARCQQAVQVGVEASMAEFNAYISAVQGHDKVRADANPMRPEVYVQTMRQVLNQSRAKASVRQHWLQPMGVALGLELSAAYAKLSDQLRQSGVRPAQYALTASGADQPSQRRGGDSAAAGAALVPDGVGTMSLKLNASQLRQLLAGEFDEADKAGASKQASKPQFNLTMPAAMEALKDISQVDEVMARLVGREQRAAPTGTPGQVQPMSLADLRDQLQTDARGVGQALGMEVVKLMVQQITSDQRLLPPVHQAVRDLEPALLRLTLIDPRFFSDKLHPARRLLEQMTQRSLAWQDPQAPGFVDFMSSLMPIVSALSSLPIESQEPFEYALDALLKSWTAQQQKERAHRENAVHALMQAEQRNLLAGRLTRELRSRPELGVVSQELQAFLTGPWTQVIAQSRLMDRTGAADPEGYEAVINDLLWSAQPEKASHNVPRLARLIPSLLARLRQGLASIDFPKDKSDALLEHLMVLHQRAMRPVAPQGAAPGPAPVATREELEAIFDARDKAGEVEEPWLAPTEALQSGFMDSGLLDSASARPAFEPTQPGGDRDSIRHGQSGGSKAAEESPIAPGTWVEFIVGNRATRTQLTWASPHGTLFMFTNAEGGSYSMTRRSMDRLLADGGLRIISDHAVVDQALDAVARAAMNNSMGERDSTL